MNIKELKDNPNYVRADPEYLEFSEVDDIWVRAYSLEKSGSVIAQHTHTHDHITLVSRGTVQMWQDGEDVGLFVAPAVITILAGKKHMFTALTNDVVLCCLHNLRGTGLESPEIMKGA
jgi:quercetin dioxygenase-like cupin family protein